MKGYIKIKKVNENQYVISEYNGYIYYVAETKDEAIFYINSSVDLPENRLP